HNGEIRIAADARMTTGLLNNDEGLMQLNGPVVLNAQEFSNRAGAFLHSDTSDTHIRIKGRLDNRDGTLASNASHIVVEGQFDNRRGNVITSGDATLQATDL
ncbi:hypothetical protein, partial [Escherichia coli]